MASLVRVVRKGFGVVGGCKADCRVLLLGVVFELLQFNHA